MAANGADGVRVAGIEDLMKTNIIHCGNCAEVMADVIPDDSIDLTVTSPPYDNLRDYNGYTFEFEPIAAELWRVTKPGGVVVWVVADATVNGSETGTSFRQALHFMGLGFRLHDTMIYYRNTPPSVAIMQKRYEQHFEYMFVLAKGEPKVCNHLREEKVYVDTRKQKEGQRKQSGEKTWRKKSSLDTKIKGNVWRIKSGGGHSTRDKIAYQHPAIFPEALARDHIISWSNPGDIVLDPMCGSGTTLKMAVEQGRRYIGIDISREYCDLSQRRVEGARVPLPGLVPESPDDEATQAALW